MLLNLQDNKKVQNQSWYTGVWVEKHVFGSEGMVEGKGCQTLAFVCWHFPFVILQFISC